VDPRELTAYITAVSEDKKAQDLVILDFRGISILFDFCIIMTGTSRIQTKAIARAIDERVKSIKPHKRQLHGLEFGTWILLDYGMTVAHIFTPQERIFYDLEELWKDIPRLAPSELLKEFSFNLSSPAGEEEAPL
jgi:ribosome-associated protein